MSKNYTFNGFLKQIQNNGSEFLGEALLARRMNNGTIEVISDNDPATGAIANGCDIMGVFKDTHGEPGIITTNGMFTNQEIEALLGAIGHLNNSCGYKLAAEYSHNVNVYTRSGVKTLRANGQLSYDNDWSPQFTSVKNGQLIISKPE